MTGDPALQKERLYPRLFGDFKVRKEAVGQASSLIFEGMTSLRAVLKSRRREIKVVYFDAARAKKRAMELDYIKKMSFEYGFSLEMCEREYIDSIATGSSHGGVIFDCGERALPYVTKIDPCAAGDGIPGFYMMLEGVEDPYNFGYALRTAYAAGVSGVVLSKRNWMSAAGVVCRASAGASELLPICTGDTEDVIGVFKKSGFRIVCAGIRNSVPAYDCDMRPPILLVVGGEKRGISRDMTSYADDVVRLDYGRKFAGSLSTASAASVLAYEVFRQSREESDVLNARGKGSEFL